MFFSVSKIRPQSAGEFPRLFVPHLVSMQPLQSEVEVVCSVQSHLEAKIGWILFVEGVERSGINKTGKLFVCLHSQI